VTLAVIVGALLTACGQVFLSSDQARDNGRDHSGEPDLMDRVRSLDLLPRFPRQDVTSRNQADRATPAEFNGVEVPAVASLRAKAQSTGDGFELSFENTPVTTVAKVVLGDILEAGYTIDPRVQGTITLASVRPVPKSDLLFVLENALRLSGVALVRDAAGYRLVPQSDAVGAGNIDQAEIRAEPGFGVSVIPLQYVSSATLLKLLDSFATKPGTVRADTTRNLLIVQGGGAERRAAIDTVMSFDVDWMRGQSVGIYPIQNGSPEPLIVELEKILDSGDGGLSQNLVKFQPIARMNAVLVVARKPDMLRTAANWIKRLDNADTTRSTVHVYRVKYGEARQLARVLSDIFIGGSGSLDTPANQIAPGSGLSATSSGNNPAVGGQAGLGNNQTSAGGFGAGQQTGPGARGGGGFGATQSTLGQPARAAAGSALDFRGAANGEQPVLQGVRITADINANSLLIYASQENYRIIQQAIRELDRPQLQVAIDATVAEVTLNDNLSYGVQFFLQNNHGSSLSNIPSSPPGQPSVNAANLVGASLNRAFPAFNLTYGSELSPNVVLDALHAVTDVRVLSNPSLVVVDNQVASLVVGNDVPISTGSASVLNSATATSNTIVNTIDYRSTGIILRVLPRISVNGTVRLDIEQEISQVVNSAGASSTTTNTTPTISERKVKSSLSIASGQTVLLAGLIQENREVDRSGIPLLDQIPKLGDAFSHQNKTIARDELIIFIRPQIIRDPVDAHYVAEELRTKLQSTIGAMGPATSAPQKSR
jgi:general secretion pathway protein D